MAQIVSEGGSGACRLRAHMPTCSRAIPAARSVRAAKQLRHCNDPSARAAANVREQSGIAAWRARSAGGVIVTREFQDGLVAPGRVGKIGKVKAYHVCNCLNNRSTLTTGPRCARCSLGASLLGGETGDGLAAQEEASQGGGSSGPRE